VTPNLDFKVTQLLNVEYLRNGMRYRHSYNEILIDLMFFSSILKNNSSQHWLSVELYLWRCTTVTSTHSGWRTCQGRALLDGIRCIKTVWDQQQNSLLKYHKLSDLKVKVKVWTLIIVPLTLATSSTLQSQNWQLIGISLMVPQGIMWLSTVRANGQLDTQCS